MSLNETKMPNVKLLMIGDSGVGKSSVLTRYTGGEFNPTFIATIGIDFKIKIVDIEGTKVKLQIWDTAGQERFRTITNAYFRGAMGIVLMYDTTDYKSFENVRAWMESITNHTTTGVKICLVGNKCDLTSAKAVTEEDGESLAEEFEVDSFFEVSAKSGHNVDGVFTSLAETIVKELIGKGKKRGTQGGDGNISLNTGQKSTCCKR